MDHDCGEMLGLLRGVSNELDVARVVRDCEEDDDRGVLLAMGVECWRCAADEDDDAAAAAPAGSNADKDFIRFMSCS